MTDTPNLEWDHWQVAWRGAAAASPRIATRAAELERRLRRHRRMAWAYTVFNVCSAIAVFAVVGYTLVRTPTLPIIVWSAGVFVFTATKLAITIWIRRDALVASAGPTTDFVAALRLRLDRRERLPRFMLRFAAAWLAFCLAYQAIWAPDGLARAAKIYAASALVLTGWWRWYRRRVRQERAQLEALCGDPDPPGDGDGGPAPQP
jgi:membrane associated rhomboid family serine protease